MPADNNVSLNTLTSADINYIRSTGRDPEQVAHQVEFLRQPRKSVPIIRPAAIGDGIQRFQDAAELFNLHKRAAAAGRISSFIPASGSGTRLFESLHQLHRDGHTSLDQIRNRASRGNAIARDALVVLENIQSFAIWEELKPGGDSIEQILRALFEADERPKALIPFHRYDDHIRNAFAEHIGEAAALGTDSQRNCRIHFTISPAHKPRFEEEWRREQPALEQMLGAQLQIDFSVQSPTTDTIAIDLDGNIRRDSAGQIIFRPGGHGALLENLSNLGGDIVLIKNIDNVARQELATKIVEVRKQIAGLLLFLESQVHEEIRNLRRSAVTDETENKLRQLNRPLRVCGVIVTSEHAGGRPFWMDVEGVGPSLQLVEGAEVDLGDPKEKELFHSSSYFSPVEIACSLRDVDGQPFDLRRFTDPKRALIAKKSLDGVPSLLYEHPGLWNGGMSLWNTVFVEIPDFTFNPVKTLSDLWSPGHRQPTA